MASNSSKRQLYQPAPKARAGERKARKPLAQGRLNCETESESEISSTNMIVNVAYSSEVDPTTTPHTSVPVLTETMSPRPEPPSKYLDLSDADLGISREEFLDRPQPIMVCDASYLAASPNHTEVDVVVNYEDSPARVVCHSPGRLEKSFRSNTSTASSKLSVAVGGPKPVGLAPSGLSTNSDSSTSVRLSKQVSADTLLSQQSRGLIKEILAAELGSENVDAISLSSYNSSSPQQPSPKHLQNKVLNRYPRNSSPIEEDDTADANTKTAKLLIDSTASSPERHRIRSDSYNLSEPLEPTQKDKAKEREALKFCSDDSGSEVLSLYEYVTAKKPASVVKTKNDISATPVLPVEKNNSSAAKPRKNVKQRKAVPSRHLKQATTNVSKDKSSQSSIQHSASKSNLQQKQDGVKSRVPNRKLVAAKQTPSKSATSQTSSKRLFVQKYLRSESPSPTAVQESSGEGKELSKNSCQTSTPTHDCSMFPNYADASSIHSVSAISVDASMNLSKFGVLRDSQNDHQKSAPVRKNSKKLIQMGLDLEYSRYLQACFLSSGAKKAYKEQERVAMKDLNSLWNLVQEQGEKVSKAERELERLKQMRQVDEFLDKTDPELSALIPKLPQVEEDYLKLCHALDTTRHQIPTKDIYLPDGDEDVREAYEEKMESVLRESEMLLTELNKTVDAKVHPLTQYRTCLEAVQHNVDAITTQLREGQTDLEEAQALCTRYASLTAVDCNQI